jgi:hypothetical protein
MCGAWAVWRQSSFWACRSFQGRVSTTCWAALSGVPLRMYGCLLTLPTAHALQLSLAPACCHKMLCPLLRAVPLACR